ncbi:MAG: PD-(D/E)XK nuclease family protein [Dysosmobacter welbionis]
MLDRGGFAAVGEEDLHALVRRYIEQYAAEVLQNLEGRNARFRYLFARLRNTAYAVVDQIAEEMRCSDFVPLAFELSFGERGELPAVTVSEPDAELRIGGTVDRVDGWVKDNRLYLRVVDYKSGKKAFDLAAVRMGLDIQMLLYLFALKRRASSGLAWTLSPPGCCISLPGMRFLRRAKYHAGAAPEPAGEGAAPNGPAAL